MPYAGIDGVRLYYVDEGRGEPLLLLEGLGYAVWMWHKQRPVFRERFRVVAFDNRGVGLSDAPKGPYTIEMFADDAARLMNQLGISRAHVLGVSMGGMIAQSLALRHPERVNRLVLVNTTPGGPEAAPMPAAILNGILAARALPPREALRTSMALAFTPAYVETHPEELEQLVAWRVETPQLPEAWFWQLQAGAAFNVSARLRDLRHPTLVIAGRTDRVLPPSNSDLLALRIPNARLVVFEETGHLLFIERADEFNRLVTDFLGERA